MKTAVMENQTLFDIALQYYGDARAALDMAWANGLNLSDDIRPGTLLNLPESLYTNKEAVKRYQDKKIIPATAYTR